MVFLDVIGVYWGMTPLLDALCVMRVLEPMTTLLPVSVSIMVYIKNGHLLEWVWLM